jgi:hypothetical protein
MTTQAQVGSIVAPVEVKTLGITVSAVIVVKHSMKTILILTRLMTVPRWPETPRNQRLTRAYQDRPTDEHLPSYKASQEHATTLAYATIRFGQDEPEVSENDKQHSSLAFFASSCHHKVESP